MDFEAPKRRSDLEHPLPVEKKEAADESALRALQSTPRRIGLHRRQSHRKLTLQTEGQVEATQDSNSVSPWKLEQGQAGSSLKMQVKKRSL